jgi:glycerol transport system substrate-binding protein
VPDYPKLAQLWWKNVAVAVTGEKTPKGDPEKYLSDKGAPWKKLANEKPKGETIAYDTLLNAWKAGKVR